MNAARGLLLVASSSVLLALILSSRSEPGAPSPSPARPPAEAAVGPEPAPEAPAENVVGRDGTGRPAAGDLAAGPTAADSERGAVRLRIRLVNAETGEPLVGGRAVVDRSATEIERGSTGSVRLNVEPPDGYVTERPGPVDLLFPVSRYTSSVVATVPVWPEARLTAIVSEPDGRPAVGAVVHRVGFLRGMRDVPRATTDGEGRAFVRGVPAIPGEEVVVPAGKDGRYGVAKPVRVARSTREVIAFVTLPAEPNEPYGYRGPSGSVPC